MSTFINEDKSIYIQISEMIESDILSGLLAEGDRAPSTNELAKDHTINPATAAKGIAILVEEEILYKKRGVGMFVSDGAKQKIKDKRQNSFKENYVIPTLIEANALSIPRETLADMILNTEIGGHDDE